MGIQTYPAGVVPSSLDIQSRLSAVELAPSRDNLITNGEFEIWGASPSVPTGWLATVGTGTPTTLRETSIVARGSQSLKVTIPSNADVMRMGTSEFAVQPGDVVWVRFYGRCTSLLGRYQVNLMTNTATNPPDIGAPFVATQYSAQMVTTVADTWQEYVYSFVVPAGHYRARVYIDESVSSAVTAQFYLDSVSVYVPSIARKDDSGWINATYAGTFQGYGTSWGNAQYRRINGVVHMRGLSRLSGANDYSPLTVFTLPVGFRPVGMWHLFIVAAASGSMRVNVYDDGRVTTEGAIAGSPNISSSGWFSLAGVSLPADA